MSAKAILNAAYKAGIVPKHLYGQTQQKTLQARLSEDILARRSSSLFYRTKPGYFFVTELLSDPLIPDSYKEPFPARRRTRDLKRDYTLTIDASFIAEHRGHALQSWTDLLADADKANAIRYVLPHEVGSERIIVWTFTLVRKGSKVLSYRLGRYRDDHDSFANRQSIGFPGLLSANDRTLFSPEDYGASDNALGVILADLDLSPNAFVNESIGAPLSRYPLLVEAGAGGKALLLVMDWSCPDWFEPTTRRLSINDPKWIDFIFHPNNPDDFEPWSMATMDSIIERKAGVKWPEA